MKKIWRTILYLTTNYWTYILATAIPLILAVSIMYNLRLYDPNGTDSICYSAIRCSKTSEAEKERATHILIYPSRRKYEKQKVNLYRIEYRPGDTVPVSELSTSDYGDWSAFLNDNPLPDGYIAVFERNLNAIIIISEEEIWGYAKEGSYKECLWEVIHNSYRVPLSWLLETVSSWSA